MRRLLLLVFILITLYPSVHSQDKGEKTQFTFKDTRIVNGQSVETMDEGQMKFIISHRFGNVSGGLEEFFGLDQSTIRLGLDYGVYDWLTVGVGRSSFEKTVDGFLKAKVFHQRVDNHSPVSLTLLSSIAVRTIDFDDERDEFFSSRLFYNFQAIVARKFSEQFSLQIMPTLIHRNLVNTASSNNDVIAIGAGTRYQLTKMISFQTEYYHTLPDQIDDVFTNSLSLGFDIETKNHVFQLNFSNSRGMIEKFFIGETRAKWEDGDFFFGFNITRDFQVKGKKYK